MIISGGSGYRRRPTGKLASTTAVNELADVVERSIPLMGTGQAGDGSVPAQIVLLKVGGQWKSRTGFYDGFIVEYPRVPSTSGGRVVEADLGTVSTTASFVIVNPGETSNAAGGSLASGSYTHAIVVGSCDDGSKTLAQSVHLPSGTANFRLTQVGGNAGTVSQTCSFTYDVYGFWDSTKSVKIASSVAMTGSANRIDGVKYIAGSYGSGGYNASFISGTNNAAGVYLLWVDEKPDPGAC